jgi:TatA/E family protein of Tat protein translocase
MLQGFVLFFLDVSGGELLIIILVVFLVFGPQKMPEIARKIGRAMNEMKKASNDLTREFRQETSGIRNEINAAQAKVQEELNHVSREVTNTRARIHKDLSVPDEPSEGSKENSPTSGNIPETLTESDKAG